jgi:hypothetical protein
MKRYALGLAAVTAAVVLTGCETPGGYPDQTATGALAGGAIGAVSGAVIGGRHAGEGALIGGALGAVTGGLIGHALDQQQEAALRAQAPQTYVRVEQGQPLGLADIKALAKAGISDDVIISQIRNTHTAYHLSAADIIDLHDSGVSQKVIDFMINTPSSAAVAAPAVPAGSPPPPPSETVVVAPGPGYVWVPGDWTWRDGWVWVGGYWAWPPYPGAVWVRGYWRGGPYGWRRMPGHWR